MRPLRTGIEGSCPTRVLRTCLPDLTGRKTNITWGELCERQWKKKKERIKDPRYEGALRASHHVPPRGKGERRLKLNRRGTIRYDRSISACKGKCMASLLSRWTRRGRRTLALKGDANTGLTPEGNLRGERNETAPAERDEKKNEIA